MNVKRLLIIGTIIAALAGAWIGYQQFFAKHYLIDCAEKFIREKMKSPSSFKLHKATFVIMEGQPQMFIEYDAMNSFGATLRGLAVFYFDYASAPAITLPPEKYEGELRLFKLWQKRVDKSPEKLTPFENCRVTKIIIDDTEMPETSLLLFNSSTYAPKSDYKGRTIGGSIDKLNDDGTENYTFETVEYTPGAIPPYK